ncbi:hypothetical protein XENOCAPTIV_016443 [Xenoophorus captivus]|uniref:Uncharacterized protein n=1 Tax=Xenoophorus captivus TaxID=1517983 RepID=A0ABV0QS71_9TELE
MKASGDPSAGQEELLGPLGEEQSCSSSFIRNTRNDSDFQGPLRSFLASDHLFFPHRTFLRTYLDALNGKTTSLQVQQASRTMKDEWRPAEVPKQSEEPPQLINLILIGH